MKTQPLMICKRCGHKATDHNEYGCQHHAKLAALAVVAIIVIVAVVAVATLAAVSFATAVAFLIAAIVFVISLVITNIGCDCPETNHTHKYNKCECGDERR